MRASGQKCGMRSAAIQKEEQHLNTIKQLCASGLRAMSIENHDVWMGSHDSGNTSMLRLNEVKESLTCKRSNECHVTTP